MPTSKKRILIVEDEEAIVRALQRKLKQSGYETHVATNGELALEAMEGDTFDLILLDLLMPKVDGFAVLEGARARKIKTPILVLSNLDKPTSIERAKQLGAREYFIKANMPIAELIERVGRMFD